MTRGQPWWFGAWFVVGAALALAVLGAMTIGIFVLPIALVAIGALLARERSRTGMQGLVAGAGLPFLYVALLNRDGPGEVCTRMTNGTSCSQEHSPWPWLAIGVLLLVLGVSLFLRADRRHSVH